MITRTDFSPVKSRRVSALESSWNSTIQLPNQPRRHQQMSKDIKKFVFNSMDGDIHQAERQAAQRARKTDGMDIFGKISSTFNFKHHDGTDAKTELKVLKIILVREGQIMTLAHLSEKARTAENVSHSCSAILEVLAEIRESTLNYLEALCLWRNSIPDGHTMSPRIFFWENKNYTLKIVNDLDFLADNELIIQALNISPEQFRSNPLMLTNNLDDPNTWMNPIDRAGQDAGGILQGPIFESRLRLRYAERILLQEIELSSNPSVEDAGTFLTEPQSQQPQGYGQFATKYQPAPQPMKGSVAPVQSVKKQPMRGSAALESDADDDSFSREEEGLGGLADKSMWGLPDSFDGNMHAESGDSESAVRASLPNSRSSSINMSAPNSSQGMRFTPGLNSLRAVSGNTHTASHGIANDSARFEYGHDFFSGHWAESQAFQGSSIEGSAVGAPPPAAGGGGPNDIFFMDDGHNMSAKTKRTLKSHDGDDASVSSQLSIRSVDSVASVEIHVVSNVRHPPRNLVLAATACVILLTPGPEIPADVSWSAFLKMCTKVNVSALLRALNPMKVHKYKVLAIKPILAQLTDDASYDGLMSNTTPFQEYTAINKLVTWLQHFTTQSIALQSQRKTHAILSPSPDTAARKLREKRDAAKVALLAPGEVDISQLYTSADLNLDDLPSHQRVIPSGSLQLAPFYSEVDTTLYKAPLLIALLAAFERKGTGRTKHKPRPPRSSKNVELDEAGGEFDRLVVKVYDVTGSAEFQHTVIIREYAIFLAEMEENYHNLAHKYFQPEDRDWWAENIIRVLSIQPKPNDNIKVSISKKAIEQIISEGVASGVTPQKRLKPKPEPVLQKPLAPTSEVAVKKRDPLTSKLKKEHLANSSHTLRAPVVSSSGARTKSPTGVQKLVSDNKSSHPTLSKVGSVKAAPAAKVPVGASHKASATPGRAASPHVPKAAAAVTKPATLSKAMTAPIATSKAGSVSAKSLLKPVTKSTKSPGAATLKSAKAAPSRASEPVLDNNTAATEEQITSVIDSIKDVERASSLPPAAISEDDGEVEYIDDFASVEVGGNNNNNDHDEGGELLLPGATSGELAEEGGGNGYDDDLGYGEDFDEGDGDASPMLPVEVVSHLQSAPELEDQPEQEEYEQEYEQEEDQEPEQEQEQAQEGEQEGPQAPPQGSEPQAEPQPQAEAMEEQGQAAENPAPVPTSARALEATTEPVIETKATPVVEANLDANDAGYDEDFDPEPVHPAEVPPPQVSEVSRSASTKEEETITDVESDVKDTAANETVLSEPGPILESEREPPQPSRPSESVQKPPPQHQEALLVKVCDEQAPAEPEAEPTQADAPQQGTVALAEKEAPLVPEDDDEVSLQPEPAGGAHNTDGTGLGGEYDEDFEDGNSAFTGGVNSFDTTDAVPGNQVYGDGNGNGVYKAYTTDTLDSAPQAISIKENENRYYSDFEENSVGAASGVILDDHSAADAPASGDHNRPLSAIEAAQREFDEIGEEDGVFFDSVDEEYI